MVPFFDVISSVLTFFVRINAKILYFNPRVGGLVDFSRAALCLSR
jgi:hypothetical protein